MNKSFENLIILLLVIAGGLSLLLLHQLRSQRSFKRASEIERENKKKVVKSIASIIAFRRNYVGAYPRVLFHATKEAALGKYKNADGSNNFVTSSNTGSNELTFFRTFPDASFKDIVRPNLQTLYGSAWLDLNMGPVALYIPPTNRDKKSPRQKRYVLVNFLDEYTNVIFRTGSEYYDSENEDRFIVARPKTGAAPKLCSSLAELMAINNRKTHSTILPGEKLRETVREDFVSSTRFVWVIIRIECRSVEEYPVIHSYQNGFRILSLTSFEPSHLPLSKGVLCSSTSDPPLLILDDSDKWPVFSDRTKKLFSSSVSKSENETSTLQLSPPEIAAQLTMDEFFGTDFAQTYLDYQKQLGVICSNKVFELPGSSDIKEKVQGMMLGANQEIAKYGKTMGTNISSNPDSGYLVVSDFPTYSVGDAAVSVGWRATLDPTRIGRYADGSGGVNLMDRAAVAMNLLGANLPEDSLYASAHLDSDGNPLNTSQTYRVYFPDGAPENRAFWSLTAYDSKGYLLKNTPEHKYSVSSSDLKNLYLTESNSQLNIGIGNFNLETSSRLAGTIRLPVVKSVEDGEKFNLVFRIYAPAKYLTSGATFWYYPVIKRFK